MRKILFPSPFQLKAYGFDRTIQSPDCKYAALAEEDDNYIICRMQEDGSFEDLITVPKSEPFAELVAFNSFIGTFAEAVIRKLRKRKKYKKEIKKFWRCKK